MRAEDSPVITDDIYSLACGPDRRVTLHSGCIVNGIRFRTMARDTCLKTQNSGVVVKGDDQSEDKDFYGVLVDIIELEYLYGNRVFLFKCDWWDISRRTGIHVDKYFTSVNVSKTWYENDPFVLATQARQVFYVNDTKLRGDWKVVQRVDPRNMYDVVEKDEENGNDETYQQEEQLTVVNNNEDEVEGETEETTPLQLNRTDISKSNVNANVLRVQMERNQKEDASINVDEIEEDDTLMDYFSEDDVVIVSDSDSDID